MSGGSRPARAREENPEHQDGDGSRPMLDRYKDLLERCLASRMELQDKLRHANGEIDRLRRMLAIERRIRDPDGRDPGA